MRRTSARAAGALRLALLLALPAAPAAAQLDPVQQLEASCEARRVLAMTDAEVGASALRAHHPRVLLDSLAPVLGRGAYGVAMTAVVRNARAALAGRVDPAVLQRYERALHHLDSTFAVAVALPEREQPRYVADSVRPTRFRLDQDAQGEYSILAGTADAIRVGRATPVEQQQALCWPAITVDRLVATFGARHRSATVQALDALAARWENYVRSSYSQLPWELAVNGWLRGRGGHEPPRQQLILFHPSIGVEANGSVLRDLRRVDVAVVEPIGWIFRYNADYTRYLGLSGVLSFASDRNVAAGGYAHLWFPQAKLGYLRRADPERRRRGSFLVSVDVYDFLGGARRTLEEARSGALGRKLLEVTNATRPAP